MENKSNPAQQLAEIQIKAVAKDIQENGTIGTASKRIIDRLAKIAIKDSFIFNEQGTKLRGTGARINKIVRFVRQGWKERNVQNRYDFYGMQTVGSLTENIIVDKYLASQLVWNTEDIADTEAGLATLVSLITSAIMEELPIEFEKRILAMFKEGFENGIEWRNDKGFVATHHPKLLVCDYSTEEKTKELVDAMAEEVFAIKRLDNQITYQGKDRDYFYWISPEVDWAIQKIGAYQVFGGTKTYENFLGNKPTKILANNVKVIVTAAIPKDMPIMLMDKDTYFTALPTKMLAISGNVGTSPSEKYYSIESSAFSYQMSYWAAKYGNPVAFKNANAAASVVAYFKDIDAKTGDGKMVWKITGIAATTPSEFGIFVSDQYGTPLVQGAAQPTLVDGVAEEEKALTDVPTGTYVIEVRHLEGGVPTVDTGEIIFRTSNYQWENKTTLRGTISTIVNKKNDTSIETKEVDFNKEATTSK